MEHNGLLEVFSKTPIHFNYLKPSPESVEQLKAESEVIIMDSAKSNQLILDRTYYRLKLAGSTELTYTRAAVFNRIQALVRMVKPHFGVLVFDAFRSTQCQISLFEYVATEVQLRNPEFTRDQVFQETQKYVVHPEVKSKFSIAPHNSGGAIDLGLHQNGIPVDFGSNFDDPTQISSTAFFERDFDPSLGFSHERWMQIRLNRRILFHSMISLGFTNYQDEWWHYDLGDCMWSQEFSLPWVFDSMESAVVKKCVAYTT